MKQMILVVLLLFVLALSSNIQIAAQGDGDDVTPPETILYERTDAAAPVEFDHAAHTEWNSCEDCHGGEEPLFSDTERSTEVLSKKDMYAGKTCGGCHNGQDSFAIMTGCKKCHVE